MKNIALLHRKKKRHNRITYSWQVPLIKEKRTKVLAEYQIHTKKQLVELPGAHPLFEHPSFKGLLPLIISHVKAIYEERMTWMMGVSNPIKTIANQNIYFFDAEYDPQAISFGMFLLGWMDQQGIVTQLFVEVPQQEIKILKNFSMWLEEEDPMLIAYNSTSADESQLRKRFKHFGIDTKVLDNRFFDLFSKIIFTQSPKKQKLFLPLITLGLKTVSEYLGYEKDNTLIHNGREAPKIYKDYLDPSNNNEKQTLKEVLLLYNREDLIQTKFVWDFLNQLEGSK